MHKLDLPSHARAQPPAPQDHARAARELLSSPTLAAVLSVVLAAGNFLNHGSRLGAAAGFRLRSLNKLGDSRAADGRSTLLQLVAREVVGRAAADGRGGVGGGNDKSPVEAGAAGCKSAAAAAGPTGVGGGQQCRLLVDEVPHVVSNRLRVGFAEALQLVEQVRETCFPVFQSGGIRS
jgi:hypothetical protein